MLLVAVAVSGWHTASLTGKNLEDLRVLLNLSVTLGSLTQLGRICATISIPAWPCPRVNVAGSIVLKRHVCMTLQRLLHFKRNSR